MATKAENTRSELPRTLGPGPTEPGRRWLLPRHPGVGGLHGLGGTEAIPIYDCEAEAAGSNLPKDPGTRPDGTGPPSPLSSLLTQLSSARLGFGITNGPATYGRSVDQVLRDIPDSIVISFLDNCVTHSTEAEAHIRKVGTIVTAYRDAGLKLTVKKCNFFADETTYLGHVVNENSIHPPHRLIHGCRQEEAPATRRRRGPSPAITPSTSPTTRGSPPSRGGPCYKTEVRAVPGHHRQYIPDNTRIAQQWTDVIGKD